MFKTLKISAALLISAASMAQASTVVIVQTADGVAQETTFGIRDDLTTRGNDLAGAHVTATFSDGSNEVLTWAAYDPYTNGGTTGDNITFGAGWDGFRLSTSALLTGLDLQIGPSGSVFDISTDVDTGNDTAGSGVGYPLYFAENTLLDGVVTAQYGGIVNLTGAEAQGDLYTDLSIDFSQVAAGGLLGSVRFFSDMDTLADITDLNPVAVEEVSAVPVPATLPLMLAGLGGLGLMRRKKKRS